MKLTKASLTSPAQTPETIKSIFGVMNEKSHAQAVAADLVGAHAFTAEFDGEIDEIVALAGAACAAGESCTIDVLKNGSTVLTSTAAFTATSGKVVRLALDKDKKSFKAGDVFTVTRDYTAGGTPTPLANTTVIIRPTFSL